MLLTFISCSDKNEKKFIITGEELCKCYTESNAPDLDKKLEICIRPFNEFIKELREPNENKLSKANVEALQNLFQSGFHKMAVQLTKRCPAYRQDFLNIAINKFESLPKADAQEIVQQYENNTEIVVDSINLAAAYMTLAQRDKAEVILDLIIANDPISDHSLWMKSFNYYMKKENDKAIEVIDQAINVTNNAELKQLLGYFKNAMIPIDDESPEDIVITFNREK